MKLSKYEQEVVINFNTNKNKATVYTANPTMDMVLRIGKMDKLCKEFPEVSKSYVLPKNLVRIGKPRTLSEEHQIESKISIGIYESCRIRYKCYPNWVIAVFKDC